MSPENDVDRFLERFEPAIAAIARRALGRLRKRYPGAHVLVYDNFNALVFAFGKGLARNDFLFSLAVYPRYVTLFLTGGASLDDPQGLLEGSGAVFRHLKLLEGDAMLERPAVKRLLQQVVARTEPPLPERGDTLVIKSISKKQRPRRPALSGARNTSARSRARAS